MRSFLRQTKRYMVELVERSFPKRLTSDNLTVFETSVGVKYQNGRFDSSRFDEYVTHDIPYESAEIRFADLVLPPDLLRNRYTLCGKSILDSPHYHLIDAIARGRLTSEHEYLTRVMMGTLDARLPKKTTVEFLLHKFQARQAELLRGDTVTIYVIKMTFQDRPVYVIADGKHRAAMVAYFNFPELLHLRVISGDFAKEPFFSNVYSYTLNMNQTEYSINQEMIKACQNEPQIAGNC